MGAGSVAAVVGLIAICFAGCGAVAYRWAPAPPPLAAAARCGRRRDGSKRWDQALLWFRGLTSVYCLAVLCGAVVTGRAHGQQFCFFTIWSWTLLIAYFASASFATGLYLRGDSACDGPDGELLGAAPGPASHRRLARLCQVMLSTLAASAVMLDTVLWSVLFPADPDPHKETELNFFSYHMHGLNIVLVAVELCVNSLTLRAADIAIALFWPLAYSAFTILRIGLTPSMRSCLTDHDETLCKSGIIPGRVHIVWPYFFMDTSKPSAFAWYAGLAALFAMAYFAVVAAIRCASRGRRAPAREQARELT